MPSTTYTDIQFAALDEISRRSTPKGERKPFVHHATLGDTMFKASGKALKEFAGDALVTDKEPEVVAMMSSATIQAESVKKPHPMKGKSKLGLTDEQVAERNRLYETLGNGKAYHDACLVAEGPWGVGIPTTKNGLVNA